MSILDTSTLIGRGVDYRSPGGDALHGVVRSATYNPFGEFVLVLHPDPHPTGLAADTVLLGPAAEVLLPQLVDQGNRRNAA